MENKQGNVTQISKQNNACEIDGVWYSLGQNVRMQYVKKGPCEYSTQETPQGQNDLVVFIKSVGQTSQQPQTAQPGAPQPQFPQYPQQPQQPTDEGMHRMSALKAASRIYQGTGQEEDFKRLTDEVGHYIEHGFWAQNA